MAMHYPRIALICISFERNCVSFNITLLSRSHQNICTFSWFSISYVSLTTRIFKLFLDLALDCPLLVPKINHVHCQQDGFLVLACLYAEFSPTLSLIYVLPFFMNHIKIIFFMNHVNSYLLLADRLLRQSYRILA